MCTAAHIMHGFWTWFIATCALNFHPHCLHVRCISMYLFYTGAAQMCSLSKSVVVSRRNRALSFYILHNVTRCRETLVVFVCVCMCVTVTDKIAWVHRFISSEQRCNNLNLRFSLDGKTALEFARDQMITCINISSFHSWFRINSFITGCFQSVIKIHIDLLIFGGIFLFRYMNFND